MQYFCSCNLWTADLPLSLTATCSSQTVLRTNSAGRRVHTRKFWIKLLLTLRLVKRPRRVRSFKSSRRLPATLSTCNECCRYPEQKVRIRHDTRRGDLGQRSLWQSKSTVQRPFEQRPPSTDTLWNLSRCGVRSFYCGHLCTMRINGKIPREAMLITQMLRDVSQWSWNVPRSHLYKVPGITYTMCTCLNT